MNIYELITPSDPITFKAKDDKIAYACAILLGGGQAGCENKTTGENLQTLIMFAPEPVEIVQEYIGSTISDFLDDNKAEIKECFESFAYGSVSDRETYDSAIESITDKKKLEAFKKKHEDKNRSSMSQWVKSAWEIAENMSA